MVKAYHQEPKALRVEIWKQGHITAWQLLRICAWKAANANLAYLPLNREEFIEERTGQALEAVRRFKSRDVVRDHIDWDSWERAVRDAIGSHTAKSGLLGIQGIAYPTATAVLCMVNPRAFPVMDRWTVGDVFTDLSSPQRAYTALGYRAFTERLSELGKAQFHGLSVHEVDQAIMNSAMGRGTRVDFKKVPLPNRS